MKNKILSLVLTAAMILACTSVCFAWNFGGHTIEATPVGDIQNNITQILGYAQWIGFVVAVAMCIWVGVKYITAGAGDKAKIKDTLIPMLIGAALVALAPVIANAIFTAFNSSGTTTLN